MDVSLPLMHTIFRIILLLQTVWTVEVDFNEYNAEETHLSLFVKGITSIKNIEKMVNLEILSLNNNQLTELPSEIGQLVKLRELKLGYNKLTSIPSEIGQLVKLEILYLNDNKLTELPSEIGKLESLTQLYLRKNQLTTLPPEIRQLKSLKELYLNNNQLEELPSEIGQLVKLERLYLNDNKLTTLPPEIGQLKSLKELCLNNNQLEELPSEIGQLVKLKRLYLNDNKLTTLPSEIGKLESLTQLYLRKNQLTTLPIEVTNLHSLVILDLRGNNIPELGDSTTTVGKAELRQRFGDRVMLDDDTIEFEQEEIPKDDVYNELKSKLIHWNTEVLRTMRSSSIPESKHTEESLMEVWNNIYMKKWRAEIENVESIICDNAEIIEAVYESSIEDDIKKLLEQNVSEETKNKIIAKILALLVKNRDQGTLSWNISKLGEEDKAKFRRMWDENKSMIILGNNKWTIDDFIHHIYNPTEEYRRWRIIDGNNYKDPNNHPSIVMARNLIGNILDILSDKDEDTVVSNINAICEGLEHCPDRQIAEMKTVYQILTGEIENGNMEENLNSFVKSVIGIEKERVFGYVVTPLGAGQNVHVLNVLTNKMADEIGLNRTIETGFGTMDQDRFNGWPGNILRAFYSSFTPDHMCKVLKNRINSRRPMINEALELICNSNKIKNEDKLKMCLCEEKDTIDVSDNEQVEDMIVSSDGITEEFVKWYLIEMHIVVDQSKDEASDEESEDSFVSATNEPMP